MSTAIITTDLLHQPSTPPDTATAPSDPPAVLYDTDGSLEEGELDRLIFPDVPVPPPVTVKPPAPIPKTPPAPKPKSPPSPDPKTYRGSPSCPIGLGITMFKQSSPKPGSPDSVVAAGTVAAPAPIRIDLSGPPSPPPIAVEIAPPSPVAPPTPKEPVLSSGSDHELTADQIAKMKVLYGSNDGKRKQADENNSSSNSSDSDLVPAKKAKVTTTPAVGKQPTPAHKSGYWRLVIRPRYIMAMAKDWDEGTAMLPMLDAKVEELGGWADVITWLLTELRKSPHTFQHGRVLSALCWAGCDADQRNTVVKCHKAVIGEVSGSDSEHDHDTAISELAKQKMMKWLWQYSLRGCWISTLPIHVCMFKRNMVPTKDETTPNLLKFWTNKKPRNPPKPTW